MKGIHHLGLTVSDLDGSSQFFCELLGWKQVRKVEEYPAIFVSNEHVMFTLWQADKISTPFDRKTNVGLHHVALHLESADELQELYQKLSSSDLVNIDFAPEFIGNGPAKHMMVFEPSGIRIEFIWTP